MKKILSVLIIILGISVIQILIFDFPKLFATSSKSSEKYIYHTVRKGETLEKIAQTYGVSIRELREWNRLKGNKIQVGSRLIVGIKKVKEEKPKEEIKTRPEKTEEGYVYYVVKRGDTLDKIAKRYGVSIKELREWNKLRKNKIHVGQKLIVGVKETKEEKQTQKEVFKKEIKKEISDTERLFAELEKEYERLNSNPQTKKTEWLNLISKYRRIYLLYPGSQTAPKAVLKTANIYYQLYKKFSSPEDLNKAIERYHFLIENYAKSSATKEAYYWLIQIYEKDLKDEEKAEKLKAEFTQRFPKSAYLPKLEVKREVKQEVKPKTQPKIQPIAKRVERKEIEEKEVLKEKVALSNLKKVLEVQPVTGEDYSRVIINVSGNFEYQANILKGTVDKPPRIYVDIYPAVLDNKISNEITIKDSLLTRVRVAQFDEKTVRVVLDLSSLTSYKIFKLKEPYQLVLDLIGKEKKGKEEKRSTVAKNLAKKENYINLARQFGLGIKRIVIDPGHGGEDPGAVGPSGLKEKDVVLKVSELLAQKLKERLSVEVILTRNEDRFIPLIQRPAIANSKKADLFISIHANASPDGKAKGVETYYLNFTTDPEAMRVAALENAASDRSLSDLQDLIKAILTNTKLSESRLLAEKVQGELVRTLSRYYPNVENRGVKYAPFLVLVGTRMPAILVEIGFITNPEEEKLFKNPHYLEMIAEGIAKGVEIYIQSLKFSQSYYDKKS